MLLVVLGPIFFWAEISELLRKYFWASGGESHAQVKNLSVLEQWKISEQWGRSLLWTILGLIFGSLTSSCAHCEQSTMSNIIITFKPVCFSTWSVIFTNLKTSFTIKSFFHHELIVPWSCVTKFHPIIAEKNFQIYQIDWLSLFEVSQGSLFEVSPIKYQVNF